VKFLRLLIAASAGTHMLNLVLNNTPKVNSEPSALEQTASSNDSSEQKSFLEAFRALNDVSDQQAPRTSEALGTDQEVVDNPDEAPANEFTHSDSAEKSEDNIGDEQQKPQGEAADTSGQDLLAQINAANQQKTDVVRHQSSSDGTDEQQTGGADKQSFKFLYDNLNDEIVVKNHPKDQVGIPKVPENVSFQADEKPTEEALKSELSKATQGKAEQIIEGEEAAVKNSKKEAQLNDAPKKLNNEVAAKQVVNEEEKAKLHVAADYDAKASQGKLSADFGQQTKNDSVLTAAQSKAQSDKAPQQSDIAKQVHDILNKAQSTVPASEASPEISAAEVKLSQTLNKQLESLSSNERKVLQQGLQQLTDSGKASPMVERALSQLAALEEQDATQSKSLNPPLNVNVSGTTNKTVSYNSTKVDKESIKSEMKNAFKGTEKDATNALFMNENKKEFNNLVNSIAQAMPTPQAEQLFRAIASPVQIASQQVDNVEFVKYVEQIEAAQHHSQQTQHANSTTQKVTVDPQLLQAINIARNDAAKVLQEKVSMMLNLNNQEAEIRLDPRELGSMQIRIRTDAEQAQVNFVVQNQQAKDLLEESMPKLREMLAEQGIELGESNIQHGGEGGSDTSDDNKGSSLANSDTTNGSSSEENSNSGARPNINDGSSIDYYA
jgi:flagellar hook-length control protein FliK